jgi:hypothetical protein
VGCFDDELPPSDPPQLTVYVTEPEIAATLLGPDGAPLAVFYDRPVIPFGFQRRTRE